MECCSLGHGRLVYWIVRYGGKDGYQMVEKVSLPPLHDGVSCVVIGSFVLRPPLPLLSQWWTWLMQPLGRLADDSEIPSRTL